MGNKRHKVTHLDVQDIFKTMAKQNKEFAGEDLVFIVKPGTLFTDTAEHLLKHKGIEIVKDEAAPIDSAYLLDRATYAKYNARFKKK